MKTAHIKLNSQTDYYAAPDCSAQCENGGSPKADGTQGCNCNTETEKFVSDIHIGYLCIFNGCAFGYSSAYMIDNQTMSSLSNKIEISGHNVVQIGSNNSNTTWVKFDDELNGAFIGVFKIVLTIDNNDYELFWDATSKSYRSNVQIFNNSDIGKTKKVSIRLN